ncbi:MAG TPA: PKD domain-containing protein [Cyclobacteriaceae bacterium]|nr:PKD domain-containing protein [Cyclobacteriaceae bacterium]
MYFKNRFLTILLVLLFSFPVNLLAQGKVISREAKSTITPVEMDIGDTLKFKLRNGQVRTLVLEQTAADVIITNLNELKKDQPGGATLYHFTGKISIDGHSMDMERYVGSQESFYEPYVINGMRIWFDGVADIREVIIGEHGGKSCECLPEKDARFGITDMTDKISPIALREWYVNRENFIDIADSYNGDDPWMGAYNGFEAHGGLDINMPNGTANFTPIPIDDHYFFNSLANGDNNNRWKGIHTWENGDVWTVQNHHMLNLLVPEHTPIPAGVHYADAAGVHVGSHYHAHYVFRTKPPEEEKETLLDPWIIFWQIFEDNKMRNDEIAAGMAPLGPGIAGQAVSFEPAGTRPGLHQEKLHYYWTFGDGGISHEKAPQYTFLRPGIYPVTLVVVDGARQDSFTQHITIDGRETDQPALGLAAPDEPSFRKRPVHMLDVYGKQPGITPHSLFFFARETRPVPNEKVITLSNLGTGTLPEMEEPHIQYDEGDGWLSVRKAGKGNGQQLFVSVDATGMPTGVYTARVRISSPGALNGVQHFTVNLTIPTYPPADRETRDLTRETIDNEDQRVNRFYSTPYFWVGPRFHRWEEKGNGEFYLTNGGRSRKGEFARFTPDLEAGKYEVSFADATPFDPARRAMSRQGQQPVNPELNPEPRFAVRVVSKQGAETIWMEPAKSPVIGVFEFDEGMDGFVEILAEGSTGQVLVDAVTFEKIVE